MLMMLVKSSLNNMGNYLKKVKFVKSIVDVKEAPNDYSHEVLFVGKSNVGKSSLINALVNNKKMAFTSSQPGHTRLLNYFSVEDNFYLVDCPGYGYSKKKDLDYTWYAKMIDSYFLDNKKLSLIVFLLDSRHLPTDDDLDFYTYLKHFNYPFIICMTKCDKLNMSLKSKINKNIKEKFGEDAAKETVFLTSINDKNSIFKLADYIKEKVGG